MITKPKNDTLFRVNTTTTLLPFLLTERGGSRTTIKSLLSHRQVSVNGTIQTRHDVSLKAGDQVSVLSGKGNIELRHPKLKLVYEDEYLIVVEKKQGLLTVATHPGSTETTVFSILKNYVKKQNIRNGIYVVHRLDRETSGLLVFAKTADLQHYMREYWRQLVQRRSYIAVAEGIFQTKEGKIQSWFTEDKRNAMVYSSPVDDGGDLAITNYKVLNETNEYDGLSLVELNLETGRTNQIRVHLAGKGHPVLGDRKYGRGNENSPIDRLCLHAKVLEFIHPGTEQVVHFESPVPRDFTRLFRG